MLPVTAIIVTVLTTTLEPDMNTLDTVIRDTIRNRQTNDLRLIESMANKDASHAQTEAAIMSILSGVKHSTNPRHYSTELRERIV